ncbi:hypothetical protein KL938_002128 [Ogataea parapolymorpha]|nr:hypothetical protein KL938_002128 [Ogataea parapolymorpha]
MASKLDACLDLALGLILRSAMRGKKTDLFGIAKLHDKHTDNPMDTISPGNWNNCVLEGPEHYDWDRMARLKDVVKINADPVDELEVDLPRSLAIVLQKIMEMNPKKTKKEKYTIYVMSDMQNPTNWDQLTELVSTAAIGYNALITIVSCMAETEAESNVVSANLDQIDELMARLQKSNGRASLSYFCALEQFRDLLRWEKEPVRIYRAARLFTGEVRLGCDLYSLDLKNCASALRLDKKELKLYAGDYDSVSDALTVKFQADAYPLTKSQKMQFTHEMGIHQDPDSDTRHLVELKHTTDKYVTFEPDSQSTEPRFLDATEVQEAYRYGSSTVPVTSSLKQLLNINTYAGLDILQFVRRKSIPPWYFHGEAEILLNNQNSSVRDQFGFNMLAQALLEHDLVAIVRYVKRNAGTARLAAMSPCIVLTDATKYKHELQTGDKRKLKEMDGEPDHYGFSLVALPFAEDERLSTFAKLSGVAESNGGDNSGSENFPSEQMLQEMGQLVDLMDLDGPDGLKKPEDHRFVELNDPESFPIPTEEMLGDDPSMFRVSEPTRRLLKQNSPKLHYISHLMRELYLRQLKAAQKIGDRYETLFETAEKMSEEYSRFLEELFGRKCEFRSPVELVEQTAEIDAVCSRLEQLLDIKPVPEVSATSKPANDQRAQPTMSIDALLNSVLPG